MVGDLLRDEPPAAVLPDTLVRLPEQRVERLLSDAVVRAGVRAHGERSDQHLQYTTPAFTPAKIQSPRAQNEHDSI